METATKRKYRTKLTDEDRQQKKEQTREKIKLYLREMRKNKPQEVKEYRQKYYNEHKDKFKGYYQSHREQRLQYQKERKELKTITDEKEQSIVKYLLQQYKSGNITLPDEVCK